MSGICVNNPGPNSQLVVKQYPIPKLKEQEILVKVKACAVNHADLLQRKGHYPPPLGASDILGLELAGQVVTIGNNVSRFKVGQAVYGLVAGGAYAEYSVIHETLAQACPKDWSFTVAAAVPEALSTAHACLVDRAQLKATESFLIHGAGSGIASLAIQMAKYLDAKVICTVGHDEKIKQAKALGANLVIQYNNQSFFEQLGTQSVDVILDYIGGDYVAAHLKLLKPKGRLIQIACQRGAKVDVSLLDLIQKQLTIEGFILRSQSLSEKGQLWKRAHTTWQQALHTQKIKPIIDSIFSIKDVALAHERMQQSKHFGKIVLEINEHAFEDFSS